MKKAVKLAKSSSYFEEEMPIGWLLAKISTTYEKEFLEKLRQFGSFSSVTGSDHRVLKFLSVGSLINSNEIARRSGLSKQAISKTISSLERRGFVRRRESRKDARSQNIELSEKGKKLISAAAQVGKELDLATLQLLGAKNFAHLKELLVKTFEACEQRIR